jgi:hypothetical protein
MDIEHLERFLAGMEASPQALAHQRGELRRCATWCIDRILALGGADADQAQKERLMAAQTRTRRLLAMVSGTATAGEHRAAH